MKTEVSNPGIEKRKSKLPFKSGALQQILAFSSLIVLILFFSITSRNFMEFSNIMNILLSTSVIGILALGTTLVIITGGIDLSIGTAMTLCSVMTGVFITFLGLPIPIGILLGILSGGLSGFLVGSAVAKMKIPPFIATLAMMMIAAGLALVISGTRPIYFSDTPAFTQVALGSIIPGIEIPNAVLIFFLMATIGYIILNKTVIGRYTFSIGSNEESTRLSGVNVNRWKIIIYSIAGLFTGVAGVVMAARLNSAQPALGMGYELEAIAAVVIGGTSLSGGKGTMVGTVIGALIMSVLTNGLRILSVPQEWQDVVIGIVVIFAVYADILRRRNT
ncbi:ribose transport system permease protein [Salinibacillus kushneri]|uniref:Ribose transport system permease protein n=1 Tax=Salinibacillus kushneri TaxID=237682 RepID=A0A1H9Z398_9BACI|nr:ABC transporter permease [Salinibacillus kushneri]SES75353.1 ribose transport system permease protein [Salinibacillus kushneri]